MYETFRIILGALAKRSDRLSFFDGWHDRLPLAENAIFDAEVGHSISVDQEDGNGPIRPQE